MTEMVEIRRKYTHNYTLYHTAPSLDTCYNPNGVLRKHTPRQLLWGIGSTSSIGRSIQSVVFHRYYSSCDQSIIFWLWGGVHVKSDSVRLRCRIAIHVHHTLGWV